jgi:5-formyltetrahydrofolate cyclo-ligase
MTPGDRFSSRPPSQQGVSPLLPTKAALRARFRAYRSALSASAYARRSRLICENLAALPDIQRAGVLLGYWPQTPKREVDVRPLVRDLRDADRTVALPVVTSFERGRPAMTVRQYTGPDCLAANRWGLQEPQDTPRVDAKALDAVLVPAFGVGRNGHRIGHGYGFYDAFLNGLSAATVIPAYRACVVPTVPAEDHDVPVGVIVTEDEVIRP